MYIWMAIRVDLNARTRCSGRGGVRVEWMGKGEVVMERNRKSKDGKMSREGKALVGFLKERG